MTIFVHYQRIQPFLYRVRWFLLGLAGLLLVIGIIEWELILQRSGEDWISPYITFVDVLYILFFILSAIAFDHAPLPYSKAMTWLGSKSYGIYLIHLICIIYFAKLIYHIAPEIMAYQLVYQPLLLAAALGLPLLFMEIIQRSPIKRIYPYLFG